MINAVVGELVCVGAQTASILAYGIEYELIISSQTATKLSCLEGAERKSVRLLAYLQHTEDSMRLFGFSDEEERRLFLELVKVNGIGPKQAMKILSGVSVSDFIAALDSSDVNFLSKIPGLGAKTSQKIILTLRDTLVFTTDKSVTSGSVINSTNKYREIFDALVEMGYDRKKVDDCISQLLFDNEKQLQNKSHSEIEEWLFRSAVIRLS